jgi:FecR protein
MVQWLRPANIRWPAVLVAISALAACGTTPPERRAETSAVGWSVVERVGEARFSPPDAPWLAVITGRAITEGSEVTTGPGGRLILAAPGRHISVGPGSSFVLPRAKSSDPLEQRAGWLRYRMANALGEPFRIRTRSLDVEFMSAVLDVRVEQDATEVTVKEGEVRIATPDGLRRTEVAAGESARASGPGGTQLALRRSPGDAPEPVLPAILPAIHSPPTAAVAPATARRPATADVPRPEPATSPTAVDGPGLDDPRPRQSAQAISLTPATATPGTPSLTGGAGARDPGANTALPAVTGEHAAAGAASAIDPIPPAAVRRAKLERLTAGVIDGVQPVRPNPAPAPSLAPAPRSLAPAPESQP